MDGKTERPERREEEIVLRELQLPYVPVHEPPWRKQRRFHVTSLYQQPITAWVWLVRRNQPKSGTRLTSAQPNTIDTVSRVDQSQCHQRHGNHHNNAAWRQQAGTDVGAEFLTLFVFELRTSAGQTHRQIDGRTGKTRNAAYRTAS